MNFIFVVHLLAASIVCQEVYENFSDSTPYSMDENATESLLRKRNITFLPPPDKSDNITDKSLEKDTTSKNKVTSGPLQEQSTKSMVREPTIKEQSNLSKTRSNDAISWTIDSTYSELKTVASQEEDNNVTDSREIRVFDKSVKNKPTEPFKPSPSLGIFYDLDNFGNLPEQNNGRKFSPIVKDDAKNFVKFNDDSSNVPYRGSKEQNGFGKFPYKFERQIPKGFDKWRASQLESKPTAEVPVFIPAGGLYQVPYALNKESPDGFQREKDFELYHEGTRNQKLKKKNPWKGLMHLVTALLPVGLIVSALSPNVITIETPQARSKLRKRSANVVPPLSAAADACRRRILCELYAAPEMRERAPATAAQRRTELMDEECAVHRCSEPPAMAELVAWVRRRLRWGGAHRTPPTAG